MGLFALGSELLGNPAFPVSSSRENMAMVGVLF